MKSKRVFDIAVSGSGLIIAAPLMSTLALAIWWHDRGSPLYRAKRCGRGGRTFTMYKFRTMVLNADRLGGSSTGSNDPRITPVGRLMRATKADELPQLVNVFRGEMSLVGPRPNIDWEVASYSSEELQLMTVRPGITDVASIAFADEGEILANEADPDLAYEQLIRPWKSRLGLVYVQHAGVVLDLQVIALTLLNSLNRSLALELLSSLLRRLGASSQEVEIALRRQPLVPTPPPGYEHVLTVVPNMAA